MKTHFKLKTLNAKLFGFAGLAICSIGAVHAQENTPNIGDDFIKAPEIRVSETSALIIANVDTDKDGVIDHLDNCPVDANGGQWDKDKDGIGNECDTDIDGDGCANDIEIALGTMPWQADSVPAVCELPQGGDSDGDGVVDSVDNCPSVANTGQWDKDKDGIGNACDDDIDGDGCNNDIEMALGSKMWNPQSKPQSCIMPTGPDQDGDGIVDSSDNCPSDQNSGQWDKDDDGLGNECDDDIDGDGATNAEEIAAKTKVWDKESFPIKSLDNDDDGINNDSDNCPDIANVGQDDWDKDNLGDVCDGDLDGDTVANNIDQCLTPISEPVNEVGCPVDIAIVPTPNVLIEAEDYVRFLDTTPGNKIYDGSSGDYRSDDVDIEATGDVNGGYHIGYLVEGEWLEYDVEVAPGIYKVIARVASETSMGKMSVSIDGEDAGLRNITYTGGWNTFSDIQIGRIEITEAGEKNVRIDISGGEFNLNWIKLSTDGICQQDCPVVEDLDAYPGYTGVYDNFTLAIDDHFDSFDSSVWAKGDGAVGTEGDCRFQDQGVRMEDGKMKLVIDRQSVPAGFSENHQKNKRAYDYICGEVRTNQKIKFGRMEARFKTPSSGATGFISSLFTYDAEDFEWRELDIELEGGRPGSMQTNYIFGNNADQWNFEWQATRTWGAWERLHTTPKETSDWIVYAIEWTPDYVTWYMDGVEVRRMTNSDLDGSPMVGPQIKPLWIPEKETMIMMNFWIPIEPVSHNFGGVTTGNVYPMVAEYDWFRYYEYTPGS